jgi:hypothetical protein
MALKKPLVLGSDGLLEQLQPGDTLSGPVAEVDVAAKQNDNASPITIGQVVYIKTNSNIDLAQANTIATTKALGLVFDPSIAASATGNIQTDGVISSADWTAVVGAASLTPGALYFLSNSASGQMTSTAPTSGFRLPVGKAISATDFEISFGEIVRL